jgi:type I restriction enzyme, S subunit
MAPDGWTEITVGELLASDGGGVKTGPFGTVLKASEYSTEGVPLISVGEVGYGSLKVQSSTPRAPREVVDRLPEYVLRSGDIVFGRKGAVDRSALVRAEQDGWFLGSDGIRLRLPKSCDPGFVAYHLQTLETRSWLLQHATGTTMASLNQSTIERIPLHLPPYGGQRAIAEILGALDDKIELNRRMNETLNATSRALFKAWFVDFDPVRANAERRDPGLSQPIADLFPDSFEGSALGEIPAGWAVRSLDEIARFLNGLALQKYPSKDGRSLPVIKIAQLRAGNTDGADAASPDLRPEYVVEDGDVLFSWSGSLECVVWAGGRGALNQHLFKVTSTEFPKWLYYFWIHQHLRDFRQIAAGKATTMGHIQRHHLSDAKVVLPPSELLEALDGLMTPLVDRPWRRNVQSRTLAALRDTLLPKLISGEIRVPLAERMLKAAAV